MRLVYWLASFAMLSVGAYGFNMQRRPDAMTKQKETDTLCATLIERKAHFWKMKCENATKDVKNETCSKDLEGLNVENMIHLNNTRKYILNLEDQIHEKNQNIIFKTKELENMKITTNLYACQLEANILSLTLTLNKSESQKIEITNQLNNKLENVPECKGTENILTEEKTKEKCRQDLEESNKHIKYQMVEQCKKLVEETKKLYESKPIEKLGNRCNIETNDIQCKNKLESLRKNIDSIAGDLEVKERERRDQEDEMEVLKHELKEIKEKNNETTNILEDTNKKDIEIQDLKNHIKNMTEILKSKEEKVTDLENEISDLKNVREENTYLKNDIANSTALLKNLNANAIECASPNLNSNTKDNENLESMNSLISELKNDVKNKLDSITDLRTQFDQCVSNSFHEIDKYHEMYLDEKTNRLKCEHRG